MASAKKTSVVPLIRGKNYGPDHHIWDNNGTWWVHFSVTRQRGRSKRSRLSLHTSDRKTARLRRDQLMKSPPDKIPVLTEKWRKLRKA